jgi:sugar phosphate permease
LRALLAGMLDVSTDVRLVLITLTATLLLCAQVGVMAFFALSLVREAGYSIAAAASIFSLTQVAAIGGRIFWGWASDHVFGGSRTVPLALVAVVSCVAAASLSFVSHHAPPFAAIVIAVIFGFSAEGYTGLAMIAMAEIGGEARSGSALGVGVTVTYVAGVLAPVILGAVAQTYDYAAMWRVVAILQACAIAPVLLAHAFARRNAPAAGTDPLL